MGIWIVAKGKAMCDRCEQVLAYMEFDDNDSGYLEERTHLWCPDCYEIIKQEREAARHESTASISKE